MRNGTYAYEVICTEKIRDTDKVKHSEISVSVKHVLSRPFNRNLFTVLTVFFRLLNDSGHNLSHMCKTLTTGCTAAVHVDQTLVRFSLLEHSFQNSTHLSHDFKHNLHNTDLQHFVKMLTHCCQNCEPHIQNRIDFSLVPFKHC